MVSANDPEGSNAYCVTVPSIVFFVFTPILVLIRLWSRRATSSTIGMDDWTILASFACLLVVQILMILSVSHGFGRHVSSLAADDRLMALKLFYVAQIFYKLTINLTKAYILALSLRIFVQRWFCISCYVLLGVILSYTFATTFSSIFQCNPINGAWDKSTSPKCIDLTVNWYSNAGFSIATDILILLLPMQPIWACKLPINQKRALILVFALGGFVTVTSIMHDIASTLWTLIEQNVAIICACLPMCRLPLASILPSSNNLYGFNDTPENNSSSHSST
ncbi:uncharacterized protein F5Z01DRAFT_683959 [Emericellopsis atlantica]|uniref:Rhodopsin domain-containing protein n=1 Tax=Emericellopsis atlantica TaxID=2614577 RepID=A0A9P7ZDY5_9HYPO|nr:uncharacterized protein F5Z01DRAFT_683959 [Emericellopsis atlantica]KAG9250314.1 hypothetical protein F5Z01DRAFT_683959 [Emericellopsis atlantica]